MDDIGPVEPGLDVLLDLLTSGPTPDELAGESTALEMYRASKRPAVPDPRAPGSAAGRWQARRRRWLAAAGTVAAAAALTVAAYRQALPAPLQNVAYHVLGFVGVPRAHHPGHAPGHTRHVRHVRTPAHSSIQPVAIPPAPATPPAPQPTPTPAKAAFASAPPVLSVVVARHRIVAGQGDVLAGRLTDQGKAVPGARLYLLERPAGRRAWRVAGHATTGRGGRAVLAAADLTRNAVFRIRGPHGTLSRPVRVIVIPIVSVTIARGPHGHAEMVTASSPLAAPRDLALLQARVHGRWLTVQARELYRDDRVRFVVKVAGVERAYRVVLVPTSAHGRSVSEPVVVSSR